MSVRNTRTVFTLAGLTMALAGGVFWLVGDENEVSGRNGMILHSEASWGEVLGFESDEEAEFAAAKEKLETGETQQTVGILLGVVGAGTVLTGQFQKRKRSHIDDLLDRARLVQDRTVPTDIVDRNQPGYGDIP